MIFGPAAPLAMNVVVGLPVILPETGPPEHDAKRTLRLPVPSPEHWVPPTPIHWKKINIGLYPITCYHSRKSGP